MLSCSEDDGLLSIDNLLTAVTFCTQADPEVVTSCLEDERGGMRRAMLEIVVSGFSRPADLMRYIHCTLLHAINHEEV